uniref:Uncharacterized protein n=1 Tax=Timema cristinae TaxID=61476 RepID=A0A7R9GXW6_TIMCR|nr:unnamed protein product [Timema cristinae]
MVSLRDLAPLHLWRAQHILQRVIQDYCILAVAGAADNAIRSVVLYDDLASISDFSAPVSFSGFRSGILAEGEKSVIWIL